MVRGHEGGGDEGWSNIGERKAGGKMQWLGLFFVANEGNGLAA